VITVNAGDADPDEIAMTAIDAGADDVQVSDDALEIYTEPSELEAVRDALESQGLAVADSEATLIPKTTIQLDDAAAEQTMRLIERLEDLDDVQDVHSNFDVSDEVAAALAG
jgi:transcriptional/translational regulatory protein YebC/TACO1